MAYKMVVFDMDGTLLNNAREISPLTLEVLHKLADEGMEIVIATGRRFRYAKEPLKVLTFPVQILANNGSVIRNSVTGERSYETYMDNELFRGILEIGREFGLSPVIHVDHYEEGWDFLLDREHTDPMYSNYFRSSEATYRTVKEFEEYVGERVMVICYMGNLEVVQRLDTLINERFLEQCNTHIITSVPQVGPFLEILPYNSGKWRSLKGYAATQGIREEEIITFGDDLNDLEMVREAGLGVAMLNAVPEIKAVAKQVTSKTNDEDGAALFLKEMFKI